MATAGDILRRFRFHAVPGAPAPAGVPADRTAELEAELAPVFRTLEAAQVRAARILDEASAHAEQQRASARDHAGRIASEGRAEAAAARAESVAAGLSEAQQQRLLLLAAAQEEALRIARVSVERTPPLVEETVRRVLSMGVAR